MNEKSKKKKLVKIFLVFDSNVCMVFLRFGLEFNSEIEQL